MARLAWVAGYIPRWFTRLETVTHPSTNRARRRLTSLMRPTTLPTKPNDWLCTVMTRIYKLTACRAWLRVSCADPADAFQSVVLGWILDLLHHWRGRWAPSDCRRVQRRLQQQQQQLLLLLVVLLLLGYSGDAGNALRHPSWDANGMQFSTSDNDNDGCGGSNCPMSHGAGWWYACCSYSNINNNGVTRWQGAGTGNPDVPVSRMLIKIV